MNTDEGQEQMAIASAELAMSEKLLKMALEHLTKANQAIRSEKAPFNLELIREFNRITIKCKQAKNLMSQGMVQQLVAQGQKYVGKNFVI